MSEKPWTLTLESPDIAGVDVTDTSTWVPLTEVHGDPEGEITVHLEQEALAVLLLNEYVELLNLKGPFLVPCLNVSDVFMYACADFEPIPDVASLMSLYDLIRTMERGDLLWASQRRNQLPVWRRCKRLTESKDPPLLWSRIPVPDNWTQEQKEIWSAWANP